jgi:hypothetical protein
MNSHPVTADFVNHLNSDAGYQTLSYMQSGDLNVLCRTCKAIQLRSTAYLYHHVDLLFHISRESSRMQGQLDNFTDCYRRQRLFCETILARPDLAPLVQELTWTIDIPILPDNPLELWSYPVFPDEEPGEDDPMGQLFYQYIQMAGPFQPPTDPFQSARPNQLWPTFLLLENVKILDLRIHDYNSIDTAELSPFSAAPSSLFPNAHTVKLAGTCCIVFAKTIISYNTARIRHLAIDHLKLHDSGRVVGWSALVNNALPTLTSLTFRRTGVHSPDEPFDSDGELAAFAELAMALESARSSIRDVHIGSTTAPSGCIVYCLVPWEKGVSQANFEKMVLPT